MTDLNTALTGISVYARPMKKSRWKTPYTVAGSTAFPLREKSGVYLIRKDGEIVYIGMSQTDVYKTMYRHFQKWNDKRQIRVHYGRKDCTVRVIYCNKAQALKLEKALIVKYKPVDNPEKYEAHILDLQDKKIIKKEKQTQPDDGIGDGVDVDF